MLRTFIISHKNVACLIVLTVHTHSQVNATTVLANTTEAAPVIDSSLPDGVAEALAEYQKGEDRYKDALNAVKVKDEELQNIMRAMEREPRWSALCVASSRSFCLCRAPPMDVRSSASLPWSPSGAAAAWAVRWSTSRLSASLSISRRVHLVTPSTRFDGAWSEGAFDHADPYANATLTLQVKPGRFLPAGVRTTVKINEHAGFKVYCGMPANNPNITIRTNASCADEWSTVGATLQVGSGCAALGSWRVPHGSRRRFRRWGRPTAPPGPSKRLTRRS